MNQKVNHRAADHGIDFGHEFHGREHHFRVTRDALQYLDGGVGLDEAGLLKAYNDHLAQIHAIAEKLSRTSDALTPILLERSAFE